MKYVNFFTLLMGTLGVTSHSQGINYVCVKQVYGRQERRQMRLERGTNTYPGESTTV